MSHQGRIRCSAGLLLLLWVPEGAQGAPQDCSDCTQAVRRAIDLLPRPPPHVAVVDVDSSTPLLRAKLRGVDAFVAPDQRVIFIRMHGRALQSAVKHRASFDFVLAAVIWHEMAHLEGADEAAAQRAEEELCAQFIVGRRVSAELGLRHLTLLRNRGR